MSGYGTEWLGMFNDQQWVKEALCVETDPEAFFPEKGGSTAAAKRVCLECPVRPECLRWAMQMDEGWGVYGGYSERERRRLKRGQDVPLPQRRAS